MGDGALLQTCSCLGPDWSFRGKRSSLFMPEGLDEEKRFYDVDIRLTTPEEVHCPPFSFFLVSFIFCNSETGLNPV